MAEVIILNGIETDLDSTVGREFVASATRAGEGLISDSDLRARFEIDDANWESISKSTAVGRAVRNLSEQRIRSGQAAREAAQQHFVRAPGVLNGIMRDANASPRHRIEAAKEIRQVAVGSGDADKQAPADARDRFCITINLGSVVEHYEKDLKPMKTIEAPAGEVKTNNDDDIRGWRER